jgi:biopolymer transport protein ExbB
MIALFLMFFSRFISILNVLWPSMQLRISVGQIRDNIRNGRIDNAKIACAHSKSPVARLIEKEFLE